MRNPAPFVLTLLLALAAVVILVTRSRTEPEAQAATPAPAPEAADAGEEPQPSLSDDLVAAWPHDRSDLPTDPKAVFGQLENGMRYIILPNAEPPGRLSIRLHIDAGSLMEEEDQRGIAHFLEHMVFNGSKNFTPEELIPRMQRLGIAFGAHVNAYTSFDETVYMLDLPDLSEEMLGLGFTVMRDFADGALLKTDEIDKERGVILAEKTSRDSVDYRMMQKQFSTLMPGSLLTRRFPIGEEDIIRNAPRERFVAFYQSYYVPARMTFVVVGDMDPEVAEARIRKAFGSLTNPEAPGADPELGEIPKPEGVEAFVFSDKEVSAIELGLFAVEPFVHQPDDRATRQAKLRLALAHSMLGTRFDRLAKTEGSPILSGSASRSDVFNHMTFGSIDVAVADDRWEDATAVLEQEFRRVTEHGFTTAELAESRANTLNYYQQAVESMDSRRSDELATNLARSINGGVVITSPETDLEVVAAALDQMTPADCHEAFLDFWADKGLYLILTTKEESEDTRDNLKAAYLTSADSPVEAPEETEVKTFAYTDFGEAGEITSQEEIEDLGITRLELSNGVTVNFKHTDFEKNRIRLKARIGYGRLTSPEDKPGLPEFATAVVNQAGIGEHSTEELQQIFAGVNVSAGFSVEEDHFSISGSTTPGDLEAQLQLMTARMLHPAYRPEAIEQFHKTIPMLFQQLRHTTSGPMQEVSSWLRGGDSRFTFPKEPEVLLAYQAADLEPWLSTDFSAGSVELSVVGDFDPEVLVPAILKTFGAIDARPSRWDAPALDRSVECPEAPQTRTFTFESKIPQGEALILWQCPGPREDRRKFRRLQILSTILGDRLREEIREELGASYSPDAGVSGSLALDGFGFLMAQSNGTPESIEQLTAVTVQLADSLATEGASEDELDRARNPALADVEKALRDNGYWLSSVLAGSTIEPEKFELARDLRDDIASITLEEINQLAVEHLGKDQAIQVLIRPDSSAAPGDTQD